MISHHSINIFILSLLVVIEFWYCTNSAVVPSISWLSVYQNNSPLESSAYNLQSSPSPLGTSSSPSFLHNLPRRIEPQFGFFPLPSFRGGERRARIMRGGMSEKGSHPHLLGRFCFLRRSRHAIPQHQQERHSALDTRTHLMQQAPITLYAWFEQRASSGQCYNISRPSLTDLTQCHIIDSLRGSRTASGNRVDPLNLGTSVSIPQIMIRKCEIYPSTWQTDSAFCKRGRNGSIIRDLAFSDRHPSSSRK